MSERGVAMLLFMMIVIMTAIYLLAGLAAVKSDYDRKTAAVLGQARDALIGRAVQDANMPGSLPCPDALTNVPSGPFRNVPNDGIADTLAGNDCPSYVGRLPWRTLDLPDLRDASGERLWYALSRNFRDDDTARPINSDTRGTLSVYASDGTTLAASDAVAVIFSPGSAIGSQIRDSVIAACAATGTSIARNFCANNYLDQLNCPGSNCRNNASGPYVAGPVVDANGLAAVNDSLLVIRAGDLIPAVEKRVARALVSWLQSYHASNHYYPYPSGYDHCDENSCDGDDSVCRGRFPLTYPQVDEHGHVTHAALTLPGWVSSEKKGWFIDNQWYREIYYSVGAGALQFPSVPCGTSLSVSGSAAGALFFTPGTPVGTQARPSNFLSDYLEDAENRDGWGAGANDLYVIPTSKLNDRDRIYTLP